MVLAGVRRLLLVVALTVVASACGNEANTAPNGATNQKTEYYEDGAKKSEAEWVDGKRSGMAMNWYPTGCPMSIHHYANEVLNGLMIKWENCGDIVAIGEYEDGMPWDGYFLVNPATAIPITDVVVYESGLTYYVMKFTNGQPFTGLSESMLKEQLSSNALYRQLIDRIGSKKK